MHRTPHTLVSMIKLQDFALRLTKVFWYACIPSLLKKRNFFKIFIRFSQFVLKLEQCQSTTVKKITLKKLLLTSIHNEFTVYLLVFVGSFKLGNIIFYSDVLKLLLYLPYS